jgi:hypothetical protein
MHVPIHFSWKTLLQSANWSFGYCRHCEQHGAIRIESFKHTLYLNLIIRLSDQYATITRCDFCERRLDLPANRAVIAYSAWSHEEGLPALLLRLGLPPSSAPSTPMTDIQLHSLLSSVQQASVSLTLGPLLIFLGMLVGLILGTAAGYFVFRDQPIAEPRDRTLYICVTGAMGACAGALLAAFVDALFRRNRKATSLIASAYARYRIDLFRLSVLSQSYSKRIQKAVREVMHAENFGIT